MQSTYESTLSKQALKTAGENLKYILTYVQKKVVRVELAVIDITKIASIYSSKHF